MAEGKSTFGLDKNVACALTYVLGWVTGLLFFLVEKGDKEVRFNAVQSIILFGLINILTMVPVLGIMLSPFLFLIGLIAWILLLVKTYQGAKVKLPVIGGYAEKFSK